MLHQFKHVLEIGLIEACRKLIWRIHRFLKRLIFSLFLRKKKVVIIKNMSNAPKVSFVNDNYFNNLTNPSDSDLMKEAHDILEGLYPVHDHGAVKWDYGTKPWKEWEPDIVRSFHRHDFLLSLARAYKISKNRQYINTIKVLINLLPGCYSIDFITKYDKAIDIAIRILNWTAIFSLVRQGLNLDCNDKFLRYWYLQIEWMKANMSPGGNHRLLEALALFASGLYFPELSTSNHWKEIGFKIVFNELNRQVHDDGVHAEQSMFYHQICTTHFFKFFILCKKSNTVLPIEFEARLRAMLDYIIVSEKPDGTHPMIGDGDMLLTTDREHWEAREMIACYRSSLNGQFTNTPSNFNGWFPIYLHRQKKKENGVNTFVYREGGHVFLKDNSGQYLFFNCGPFGYSLYPHHGHADALSIEICLNNQNITMDPGGYAYRNDPIRHFVRSTAAHNTIRIDEREQSETSGVFNVGKTAKTKIVKWANTNHFDMVLGMHDGYAPTVHYRKVWLIKDGFHTFIIRDLICGSGVHSIDAHYHLSPDIVHQQHSKNKVLFYKGAAYVGSLQCYMQHGQFNIIAKSNADSKFPVSILSPKTGHYVPSQLISVQSVQELPFSLITIFTGHEDCKFAVDFHLNRLIINRKNQQFFLDIAMEDSL